MGSEEDKQGKGKGFAGLSSMVSDVDATIDSSSKQQKTNTTSSAQQRQKNDHSWGEEQSRQEQRADKKSNRPPSVLSSSKLFYIIAAVIGIVWIINLLDNKSSPTAAYSPKPSRTPVVATLEPLSKPSSDRKEDALKLLLSDEPITSNRAIQSTPPNSNQLDEQKPPVGRNNVLSNSQIRYCLAEKIRLDASESAINKYLDADVDRFNKYVSEYNSRCGEFRYRQGTLERARRDVEPYRNKLQSEGRARFVSSSSASAARQTTRQATQAVRPAADTTVKAIQKRLNELGYDAGVADGLAGRRTRAAILAFQQDSGIVANSNVSKMLLQSLLAAEKRSASTASIQFSRSERESMEAACSTDKYINGPAAYRTCINRQTAALKAGVRTPNLSALSNAERQSIEAACSTDKYLNGPAAYNSCLQKHLNALGRQGSGPDLSSLSSSEKQSIEAACSTDKYLNGPAAYNSCLQKHLNALRRQGGRPDLSTLSPSERRSIEAACSTDKYLNGPAAYNLCLSRQLAKLGS